MLDLIREPVAFLLGVTYFDVLSRTYLKVVLLAPRRAFYFFIFRLENANLYVAHYLGLFARLFVEIVADDALLRLRFPFPFDYLAVVMLLVVLVRETPGLFGHLFRRLSRPLVAERCVIGRRIYDDLASRVQVRAKLARIFVD